MKETTEQQLERLTVAGWLLIAVHCAVFAVLGPLVLFEFCPAVLEVGGRITRYAMTATVLILGGASFFSWKWVLEKLGVTILRPRPPCSRGCQDSR
jgi:hypothetical protein